MLATVIAASFFRRSMLVAILVVLQNQPLAQILSTLALQMVYLAFTLYAPFFRERRSEIAQELTILLTLYTLLPCTEDYMSDPDANAIIGHT